MEVNVFGIGAAGNKAAITAIEKMVISENKVKLVNTTVKDIPEEYKVGKNIVVQFSSMLGGCGKEPSKGAKAMEAAIKNGDIDFSTMIDDDVKAVVIVASTEGGTGCGAAPVVAQYFDLMNVPVHVFALIGFQDESRGINNTLRFFKNLPDNVILHTILNSQFLDYTQNYSKAEDAANVEFAKQLEVIIGSKMVPSYQNIDDTDLYKINTTPGYTDIKHVKLEGIKNTETFDEALIRAFDDPNCLEYDRSCKRLAIILNASAKTQQAMDDRLQVIKRYTGEPFEVFRHIQNNESDPEEWIDIIVTGMNFPEKAIVDLARKSAEMKQNLNKGLKSFEQIYAGIDVDEDDDFDMEIRKRNTNVNAMFGKAVQKQTRINNVVDPGNEDY